MRKEDRLNLMAGTFTLVLGILIMILSTGIEVKAKNGDVGSAFMPYITGGLMIVLSIIYLASTWMNVCNYKKSGIALEAESGNAIKTNYKRISISFFMLVAYALMLKPVGFIISSIIYLFIQMNIMSDNPTKKQRLLYAILSVTVPILVNIIFMNFFSMVLPEGILG